MTFIRNFALAAALAGSGFVSFSAWAVQPGETVTGYHRFLSAAGSSEDEDVAFQKARIDAYTQCYRSRLQPKPSSKLELLFPGLMGVGESKCTVSEIRFNEPRHYVCFAWYKATCVEPVSAAAMAPSDDASEREAVAVSYVDGGDGAGGVSAGNDGAEGRAAY